MAPSLKKVLSAFVDDIPEAKLQNFPGSPGTLHKDANFRLDLQGVSAIFPQFRTSMCSTVSAQVTKTAYNLQIQAKNGAPNTSVRKVAPKSVAAVLKNFSSHATVAEVRQAFHRSAEENSTATI